MVWAGFPRHQLPYEPEQRFHFQRLFEMSGGPGPDRLQLLVRPSGHNNDRQFWMGLFYLLQSVPAVDDRHVQIQEDHIEIKTGETIQRLLSVGRESNLILMAESAVQRLPNAPVIIHQ